MSLVNSIWNGDTTVAGYRADLAVTIIDGKYRDNIYGPVLRACVLDREQDVVKIWVEGNVADFFRAQVLFDNPHETQRIGRPLNRCAEELMTLLVGMRIPVVEAVGMNNVLALPYIKNGDLSRILLDPYLAVVRGKVL